MLNDIARLRRFHRAVTREAGVLDDHFLGRGRPLGPARVLNAIGGGQHEIAQLRRYLGLDSGLMSRLLRGLEHEGLITLAADPLDSRRRLAKLTEAGQAEYHAYERLSNDQAQAILHQAPDPQKLLAAMELIANTLGRDRFEVLGVAPNDPRALWAMQSYYAELAERLETGFDVSLCADPEASAMMAPRGAFFVIVSDGQTLACAGLKGTDKGYGEIKRLWVAPQARGFGLAKRLMTAIEAQARVLGITTLRLDSNTKLHEAIAMYRRLGWHEIARFNDDPYPDHFFEKHLI